MFALPYTFKPHIFSHNASFEINFNNTTRYTVLCILKLGWGGFCDFEALGPPGYSFNETKAKIVN